jgi:hypothetical protein
MKTHVFGNQRQKKEKNYETLVEFVEEHGFRSSSNTSNLLIVENLSLLLTEEIRNLSLCDVHFLALLILI